MADFNPFQFIENRQGSVEPSDNDIEHFNHFMAQRCLAMKQGFENTANAMNTEQFFALPKNIQCYAYTSFDGQYLKSKWKLSKRAKSEEHNDIVKKVMKVLECSRNDAECYLRYGNIDKEKLEEIYIKLYEPEKINFRKKKGKK